ncbi:aureobasidin A1 biosynthesis complex [Lindgomyces ingoldianus]|uniref:Aureobasidin A1 biosynthesis complex n=1 Tax=Lindgomyces ingoldianus TaxID=673940 RepID=A0ACB6Q6V7_9PLEO|nr:aureobasidin A1 biosynthesis complex [Lindgomyces ingoldianus]KAF2462564.1 aureobasidin A1 biosynthesis complex [Lindgomyces ingoldianus]
MLPQNDAETILYEELNYLLGRDFDMGDDFFELGGHSLTAMKLATRLGQRLNASVAVKDIFDYPILTDLAAAIQQGTSPHRAIVPMGYSGPVEQSFAQGRLWFLDQLNVKAMWYIIPLATRLRGPLNVDALNAALQALEQRHETLRTTFEEHSGIGAQVVHARRSGGLRIVDASTYTKAEVLDAVKAEQTRPFDLAVEPGWRVCLLRIGESDNILSVVMHHIISDGWSVDVLRRELDVFYTAALRGERGEELSSQIPALPIQYRDFALWQKQADQVAEQQRQLGYWTKQLTDSTPAEFLCDKPRPDVLSGQAGVAPVFITGGLYESLQAYCRAQQVTPFVVLLAAFRATHYRLTGTEDATIGTPIANRNRPELENLIGFFVNTQAMRITITEESFEGLVQQVRHTATEAFANQDIPFEQLVSALLPGRRDASRNPLVQVTFAVHSQRDLGRLRFEGVQGELIPIALTTRFDLEFHLFQEENCLSGNVLYASELFEAATVESMLSVFHEVLRRGLDNPETPIGTLPLTDGVSQLRNEGLLKEPKTDYPRESSIVDVFREQVALYPNALAVKDSSTELTYTELDRYSDDLAGWLCRRKMAPETLVGVLSTRSCQTITAFLGILKAGLAYLPLDINVPTARIETILRAVSGHKLALLGTDIRRPDIMLPDVEMVLIAETLGHAGTTTTILPTPSSTSLAYVIFTSGSTGKPKGVMVEHRGIVRLVKNSDVQEMMAPSSRVAHLTTIAFDIATWEIFSALLNGGSLVCVDYLTTLDSRALGALFNQEKINVSMFSSMLLKQCLASYPDCLHGLKVLFVGADRVDSRDALQAQALVDGGAGGVYDSYGPTENAVVSTLYKIDRHDPYVNGVPIGQAMSNSGAYIMDAHLQLVSTGVMGELVVTGDGLARGYTDSALDLNRFVDITIEGQKVRAYRTGDRVRYRPMDGQIEFFGRLDQQVKIRGYRVELAEVEHAILSHDIVSDAAVVVRYDQEDTGVEMVGFVTKRGDDTQKQDNTATANSHLEGWQEHFEKSRYADIYNIDRSSIGRDFMGWTSMYDGEDIPKDEMNEWLDDTIQQILDGQAAGHVLEVGSGTGMILFNLGDGLQQYVGIDPSAAAASFVRDMAQSVPDLADRVDMQVGGATDAGCLKGLQSELVIVNSVAQYFPSPEYLMEAVDTLVGLPGVRRIFFGDIRSYTLNTEFLVSRALHTLGNKASKDEVRQKIAEIGEREEELLIDPAFFTQLTSRLADRVSHVEILPKMMRATNELSAYRYAAVIHVHETADQAPAVHPIAADVWHDYHVSKMDRSSLLSLLQSSPSNQPIAISNIPYSKTILERCLVESLEEYNETTQNWIAAAREKAERCPALSAADLVELGKEAGLRVKLSWARQRSQNGAVDAVFHNYQSRHDGGRVLIQFPADDANQVPNSRTNRPLQGLQSRRVEAQVRDRLQILLPGYMVPSRIVVLDQMPFNSNRKVDRKELAKRAKTVTKSRLSRERVTPRNEMESLLCEEFTNVLGVAVSVTENFFELGGHSLMATKLASSLGRRLNTSLSVRDIFSNPVLADLASELSLKLRANGEAEASASVQADSAPFELLQAGDRSDFVQNEITPQLGDRSAKVLDVYPPTQVQKRFLHDPTTGNPRVPPVFIIDFPSDTDCERLASSCGALVQHFDIFRTTFVSVKGTLHQVVLENLAVPIEVIETDSDITSATRSVVDMDLKQPLRLGQSLLRIAILKRQQSTVRVILRMSHALYDGLSFEHIVLSLHALHNGNTLATPSRFASYIQHMVQSRALGYNYWSSVLQHSSMSIIPDVRRNLENAPRLSGTYIVEKTIPSPFLARYKITPATVFTTACAIMLAKETGSTDLLFGRVVSGRQNLPSTSQNIVGPCTNEVPVRVLIDENATLGDVLQNVQSQYVDSLPFETLGFDDLKGNCTDWPASTTDFGACTTFQNYEMRPQSQIHGQSIRLDGFSRHDDEEEAKEGADGLTRMVLRESPLHNVEITGIPEAESSRLRVIVNGNLGRFEEKTVERILEELCSALALLTGSERVLMGDALAKV